MSSTSMASLRRTPQVLAAERQKTGRPIDVRDTQIAGIALARGAPLATRNVKDFQDLNVPVINPWEARAG